MFLSICLLPATGLAVNAPRVVDQFLSLQHHGDPLAFGYIHYDVQLPGWVDIGDDPRECKHYQGVVRVNSSDGMPYFILSRSGNETPACSGAGDDPGELLIVQMGSRDKDGERLRSNRLQRDNATGDTYPDWVNWPDLRDYTVKSIHLDLSDMCTWVNDSNEQEQRPCPSWMHPGGMQVVDDVLFLAVEKGYYQDKKEGILLIDVSDPGNPVFIDEITTMLMGEVEVDLFEDKTGLLAVTREPGTDTYLIATSGGTYESSHALIFLEMNTDDLHRPGKVLEHLHNWDANTLLPDLDDDAWRCGRDCGALTLNYQTLNFVRDEYDNLFIIGLDNDTAGTDEGYDFAKMFGVQRNPDDSFTLTYTAEKHLRLSDPNMGDTDAASGVYVSPTGQLIIYTGDHDNEGPSWIRNSLEMGEFRSIMVSHTETCGPQWRGGDPGLHLGGPHEIDEGEILLVNGTLWFLEPWVHFFEEQLWYWINPYTSAVVPINSGGRGLMMDWRGNWLEDYPAWSDDYDDLDKLDFGDKAEALIWCGVPESSVWLYGEDYFGRLLQAGGGTGNNVVLIDLPGYLDGDIDSVILNWNRPSGMDYNWQLNPDPGGSLSDINAPTVTYQAGCGSYTDTLTMKYLNQDQWAAQTTIDVIGVDPSIVDLNTSGPLEEGSLITLIVTWEDPCATSVDALITWGDGAQETLIADSKVFQSTHIYSDNGNYTINVSIADADGGQDSKNLDVTVVNMPPIVDAGPDWTINPGDTLDIQATFTDPGINDTHTAQFDWGDGTNSPGVVEEENGSGTVTGSHIYPIPGNYIVTLEVTDNDGGIGTDTVSVEVRNRPPVPDIKANGSNGPVTITTADTLLVEIELDSGNYPGYPADWWVLADTPLGWYYYDLNNWRWGQSVTYQGGLSDLAPYEVLNTSGLSTGNYIFYFGVDGKKDGKITNSSLFYDSVQVTITP
jgi:hypothetical protein